MIKTLKNFNIFSLLPKNDRVKVSITPISVKFNCILCNKTNKAGIGHIAEINDDVDFDIANNRNRADVTWRLNCNFCNAQNDIHFIVKRDIEEKNGKL